LLLAFFKHVRKRFLLGELSDWGGVGEILGLDSGCVVEGLSFLIADEHIQLGVLVNKRLQL